VAAITFPHSSSSVGIKFDPTKTTFNDDDEPEEADSARWKKQVHRIAGSYFVILWSLRKACASNSRTTNQPTLPIIIANNVDLWLMHTLF
jgi:hypothetical protein